MVKVYVMESCPDCTQVKQVYKDNPAYELVDIGQQARSLKEFIVLRDNHPLLQRCVNVVTSASHASSRKTDQYSSALSITMHPWLLRLRLSMQKGLLVTWTARDADPEHLYGFAL